MRHAFFLPSEGPELAISAFSKARSILRWSILVHFFAAGELQIVILRAGATPCEPMDFFVSRAAHKAERMLILAVPIVEFVHGTHFIWVKVMLGLDIRSDIAVFLGIGMP